MNTLLQTLRKSPPVSIAQIPVERFEDYLLSTSTNRVTQQTVPLTLPRSDVLRFWLADGSKLVIRSSGTEPKIKIYGEVVQEKKKDMERDIELADERLKTLLETFQKEISSKEQTGRTR
jgi:phosphomannomutase